MRQQDDKARDNRKQIFISKSLRAKMMEVAYDLLFGGHLGARKPKTGFNFFWSVLLENDTSFCRS